MQCACLAKLAGTLCLTGGLVRVYGHPPAKHSQCQPSFYLSACRQRRGGDPGSTRGAPLQRQQPHTFILLFKTAWAPLPTPIDCPCAASLLPSLASHSQPILRQLCPPLSPPACSLASPRLPHPALSAHPTASTTVTHFRLEALRQLVPHTERANTANFLEELVAYVQRMQARRWGNTSWFV